MKKYFSFLVLALLLVSCAENKDLKLNGKIKTFETYGWACDELKNDSIEYQINTGNVILSIIFCETIVAPIILTGWEIKEPVKVKAQYEQK